MHWNLIRHMIVLWTFFFIVWFVPKDARGYTIILGIWELNDELTKIGVDNV